MIKQLKPYLKALADAIRNILGNAELLNAQDFPEWINEVFRKGKFDGQNSVWNDIQNNGEPTNYYYAFAYNRFDDNSYNPIHPIRCSDGTTPSQAIFYNNTLITDTKVEIIVSSNAGSCFAGMENCHTIRKFTPNQQTSFNNTFNGMKNLINIEIGGTIAKSVSFASCGLLSDKSQDSIISSLKVFTDTTSNTLTVHEDVYNRMVELGKDALVTAKNWTLAKSVKE